MAALKDRFNKATGRSGSVSDDPEVQREASKYRLSVTAGPSYALTTHKPVHVNTGTPTLISSPLIRAKIVVRIRNFNGVPTTCPSSSPYFGSPLHEKDQYSLAFSFVPKIDIPAEGTVWGNDFDHPVRDRLPPGFNTAFRIVKEFIDPGLDCDAYADEPWLYGPSLSCWFAFRIGEVVEDGEDFPAPAEDEAMVDGADGSGKGVREESGMPENNEKRRKYFLDAQNRRNFTFEKGRCYQADFYNPYLDFGNYALKLPGFSLKVIKYVDQKSHCLRYVFKNRESGEVFLNVNFGLLWGEDLERALEGEKEQLGNGETDGEEAARPVAKDEESQVDGSPPRDSPQEAQDGNGKAAIFAEIASLHRASQVDGPSVGSSSRSNVAQPQAKEKENTEVDEISDLLSATATSDRRKSKQQ